MSDPRKQPGIGRTILDDLKKGNFRKTLSQEYRDLKDFYFDDQQKDRLRQTGRIKRFFLISFWLLRGMYFHLPPVRRLLLLLALIFMFSPQFMMDNQSNSISLNAPGLASVILLFVLMLELKDKLLARDELEAGRRIQYALMPDQPPRISGWDIWFYTRPANDVGGDLIDHMEISSDRHALVLGDVAGKGLGAALFMAKLQATLRAFVPDYKDMAALGEKINHIFYRDSLPSSFASLVYLELQPDASEVRLLNAGHLPPLKMEADKLIEMPKGGPALGLTNSATFWEERVELASGSLLIIFSDGVTEAQNNQNIFFGERRFHELLEGCQPLTAGQLGRRIVTAVERFCADRRLSDDLSLVILKKI